MFYIEKLFLENIKKDGVNVIFELGSRDLLDALKLMAYYDKAVVYSFECNPECLVDCEENFSLMKDYIKNRIILVKNAVSENNGDVSFYPFDITKYNNKGASSMLKIDFSMRDPSDPDYNTPNPQKEIIVPGIRLDTFMESKNISNIDLICIDLQGYELNALKSLGSYLHKVKYIITETSIQSTYKNGATFKELETFLKEFNFAYKCSTMFGYEYPMLNLTGYSEFDVLFINENLVN
jgi:FkbM family methyltransferase